ncbi:MAG: hypothetical protein EOO30_15535 [Comamonadaceae bacterium]|nr:MAG: hypothetical protein EOO30_15535 [Comamonadaceae bacterium]
MELHYLDFEFSDEDSGHGSFDAMASVLPDRVPPLLEEIAAVLGWAHAAFGPPASLEDGGEWDFDLQAVAEPGRPLAARYDAASREVELGSWGAAARVTLTLTLGGTPAFCSACREAFILG